MRSDEISIVIPTRNRFALLERAVESALAAGFSEDRVVIVDDASADGTPERARTRFPLAKVLAQGRRQGPGGARNLGIRSVKTEYALMLDDDDLFRADALAIITWSTDRFPGAADYPVLQFAQNNGRLANDFAVAALKDYLNGNLYGDFAPLIRVRSFIELGFAYPDSLIGGESLLWFQVAARCGIPTWPASVMTVTDDAPSRLCSVESQLRNPAQYAVNIEAVLDVLGREIRKISPDYYRKKLAGAAIYRLLAGERGAAMNHAMSLARSGDAISCAAVMAISALPGAFVRRLFGMWRQRAFA